MREEKMKAVVIDVTLPAKKNSVGHRHPNTIALEEVERIFIGMGYEVVEGPEVEKDYYNFSNLHWHRESEILYMKKGTVELSVGGDVFRMNQGDIYFISPGELHLLSPVTLPSAYNALVFSNSLITFPKGHFFEEEFTSPLEKGEIAFPRCIKPENEYYKEVSGLVDEICDN